MRFVIYICLCIFSGSSLFTARELSLIDSNHARFTTVLTNLGNDYNSSSGVFTCRIAGQYWFSASITKHYTDHVGPTYCYIMINGSAKWSCGTTSRTLYTRPPPWQHQEVSTWTEVTGSRSVTVLILAFYTVTAWYPISQEFWLSLMFKHYQWVSFIYYWRFYQYVASDSINNCMYMYERETRVWVK